MSGQPMLAGVSRRRVAVPKSLRWRLPLSYAGIALVAALCLGVVLLITLRNYYSQREHDYLVENARAIGAAVADLVESEPSPGALRSQLKSYSFLSQTRVRLLDETEQVVADSGSPQQQQRVVALSLLDPWISPAFPGGAGETISPFGVEPELDRLSSPISRVITTTLGDDIYRSIIVIEDDSATITETVVITGSGFDGIHRSAEEPGVVVGPLGLISRMPTVGTPYGFGFDADAVSSDRKSRQIVRYPFGDDGGSPMGYVELSEGPAHGIQILEGVAWAWGVAAVVAVMLAIGVGWFVSKRISAPLLSLAATTVRMADGEFGARAPVASQDEFGLLAQSYNEMADRVEETVVTLRRFVTDAAHELHTPLTALRTNLELIAIEENDEKDRHALVDRALSQVARLAALTGGLLELSRIESDVPASSHARLDLGALLRETSEVYASQAEQAGLSFHLELPRGALIIEGDGPQLRRALGNLLDNAIKFTPSGGDVTLGARQDGRWSALWVADAGIGIPDNDLPHLFGRFHRGRNAADRPGSGLGLAIVKAIVESHGGHVTVADNGSQGAVFSVWLPAVRSAV